MPGCRRHRATTSRRAAQPPDPRLVDVHGFEPVPPRIVLAHRIGANAKSRTRVTGWKQQSGLERTRRPYAALVLDIGRVSIADLREDHVRELIAGVSRVSRSSGRRLSDRHGRRWRSERRRPPSPSNSGSGSASSPRTPPALRWPRRPARRRVGNGQPRPNPRRPSRARNGIRSRSAACRRSPRAEVRRHGASVRCELHVRAGATL